MLLPSRAVFWVLLCLSMFVFHCGPEVPQVTPDGELASETNQEKQVIVAEGTNDAEPPSLEPAPIREVTFEPTPEPSKEPGTEPRAEPAAEPRTEPKAEPSTEQPALEPTPEPLSEPLSEPRSEPVIESTPEPIAESTREPMLELTSEPTPEPVVESTTEVGVEPFVDGGVMDGGEVPEGEPVPEAAADTVIIPPASHIWAIRAGSSLKDEGHAIAVDGQGDSYITGYYASTATFGSISLKSLGGSNVFVARVSASGVVVWAVSAVIGNGEYAGGRGIALDSKGNICVTGFFTGTATFGTTVLTSKGRFDIFVAKLDKNGQWLWATRAGSAGVTTPEVDGGEALIVDAQDQIYVTGYFVKQADFGTTSLTSRGEQDIFVAKLDATGKWLWAKGAGSTALDAGTSIALDPAGGVVITGNLSGDADFGLTSLTMTGTQYAYIARLDALGNWSWATPLRSTSSVTCQDIAIDASGQIHVTGEFHGTMTLDKAMTSDPQVINIFAAKMDQNRKWLWSREAGQTGSNRSNSLALDGQGNVYITGHFSTNIQFGSTLLSSGSFRFWKLFITRLDPNGTWQWATSVDGTIGNEGHSIAIDASGAILLTGGFELAVKFGTTALTPQGRYDVFVWKLK